MKRYWCLEVEVLRRAFLTSALEGGEWSASRTDRFTRRKGTPDTRWIGSWVGPIAGLEVVEKRKIPRTETRTPILKPVAIRYAD
jgi:hypothetical protein